MECLTEFTCSVFVDGELTEIESRKVEEHLKICEHCSAMSAAFREENRLLVASIQELTDENAETHITEPAMAGASVTSGRPPAPAASPKDIVKWGGGLIGLSAVIQIAMSSPDNLSLPSFPVNLDWLNPSNLSGSLNWLMSTITYFAAEGVSRMTTLANSLSFVALIVLIFAGAVMFVRKSVSRGAMVAALGLLLVIVTSSASFAMD
ncbi:MAG TPA: zf-HC2 domain-containing protein, partial [Terriglobia bacterium]|nr:zf-HC2 domain-containing protein [Terriglobia bacterium]